MTDAQTAIRSGPRLESADSGAAMTRGTRTDAQLATIADDPDQTVLLRRRRLGLLARPRPEKPIEATAKPVRVQGLARLEVVVHLPDEGVATVNQLTIPVGRPVNFERPALADEQFFVPQLGSQMYTMAGMVTNLPAGRPRGQLPRLSAEFSGDGFAECVTVHAVAMALCEWLADAHSRAGRSTPIPTPSSRSERGRHSHDVRPVVSNIFERRARHAGGLQRTNQ